MASFMALPRELRQMIYEHIPHLRKHITYIFHNDAKTTIVHSVPSPTIRCTCSYLASEWPTAILQEAKESVWYTNEYYAVRLTVETEDIAKLADENNFLMKACRWSQVIRAGGEMTFNEFVSGNENMEEWDAKLLQLTRQAGEMLSRGSEVETMTNMSLGVR
jgi:hypothetical protein